MEQKYIDDEQKQFPDNQIERIYDVAKGEDDLRKHRIYRSNVRMVDIEKDIPGFID